MATQRVIWTVLPNGTVGEGASRRLRLSVFVSPRLRPAAGEDTTLRLFPDFQQWPARILAARFEVAFDGGPTLPAEPVGPGPEQELWSALFTEQTPTRPYVFDNHAQRQIVSYPVMRLLSTLQQPYRQLGLDSADRLPSGSTLVHALAAFDMHWNVDTEDVARRSLARGQDINEREALARFMLFHNPSTLRPEDTGLPRTPDEFHNLIDFHQAVSSLGDYPELMRRLGLIVDLEVPVGDLPAGGIANTGAARVAVDWPASGPPVTNVSNLTAYQIQGARFEAVPLTQSITGGFLALGTNQFSIVQVDVDGGLIKANNTVLSLQNTTAFDVPNEAGLPALRTGGVALVRNGRAQQTADRFNRSHAINAAIDADPPAPARVFAEDLVRGYRIDVWDSQTSTWHSLCLRKGTYRFTEAGIDRTFDDEGWVQMGATTAPSPSKPADADADDLYLHESLFRWDGWSLVTHRPGKAISHEADPAVPPATPANDPVTSFKLVTSFNVPDRSLPRLRFGTRYRIRARIADLAGNGPAVDTPGDSAIPAAASGQPFLRFEPVAAPIVVLRAPLTPDTPGEALERLVIRAFNTDESLDSSPTVALNERHIAPPRSSQLQAEAHGKFDRPGGGLQADALTYAMIRDRDAAQFKVAPLDPADPASQAVPIEPDPQLSLPYLPDPIARAAAFRNLPAVPSGSIQKVTDAGALATDALPGPDTRPGSATLIPFGDPASWPNLTPFRLVLADGTTPPTWDAIARVLTVRLPRASIVPVALSSSIMADDLKLMGVWEWIREEVDSRSQDADPHALEALTRLLGSVVQRALEGGHWMITPARTLNLVHAVQQPLGRPRLSSITAIRQREGETAAILVGSLNVHGRSTMKVDLLAEWTESVDLPAEPAPRQLQAHATADEIPLADLAPGVLRAPSRNAPIGIYEPEPSDVVMFNHDAHPRHEFGDTKHRMVRYRPVSTSRFREYYPADVPGGITRTGDSVEVDVPSSARPEAPRVRYVLPTFGWQRQADTNLVASRRLGGGLRVYMDRGWFSAGDDELLGIVYNPGLRPDTPRKERERQAPFVTEWGFDPVHLSRPGTPPLSPPHFPGSVGGFGLQLPELPGHTLSVAAYRPAFAADRGLWYCDITIDAGDAYYPFVKLALARYQPHSLQGVELSRVILANIAQLAPDRSAIVTYDPYDRDLLHVVVAGFTYQEVDEARRTDIEVTGERQYDPPRGELGWGFAPGVTTLAQNRVDSDRLLWQGQVRLPPGRKPGEYRIMIKEFERATADGPAAAPLPTVPRLVYAEGLLV